RVQHWQSPPHAYCGGALGGETDHRRGLGNPGPHGAGPVGGARGVDVLPLWQSLWHWLWRGDDGVPGGEPPVFWDGPHRHPVWLRDDGRPARARRGERAGRVGALCHGLVSPRPAAVHGLQSGGRSGDPAPGILGPGADSALGGRVPAGGSLDDAATIPVVTETTGGVTPGRPVQQGSPAYTFHAVPVQPLDLPARGTCPLLSRHIAQGGTTMERPL